MASWVWNRNEALVLKSNHIIDVFWMRNIRKSYDWRHPLEEAAVRMLSSSLPPLFMPGNRIKSALRRLSISATANPASLLLGWSHFFSSFKPKQGDFQWHLSLQKLNFGLGIAEANCNNPWNEPACSRMPRRSASCTPCNRNQFFSCGKCC